MDRDLEGNKRNTKWRLVLRRTDGSIEITKDDDLYELANLIRNGQGCLDSIPDGWTPELMVGSVTTILIYPPKGINVFDKVTLSNCTALSTVSYALKSFQDYCIDKVPDGWTIEIQEVKKP